MKFKYLAPFIIAALLISTWMPFPADWNNPAIQPVQAASETLQLVIDNKTGESFTLTMKGPATYNWNIRPGKQTMQAVAGKYKYNYKACGNTAFKDTIEVKKNNQTLVLAACKGNQPTTGIIKVKVDNKTGESFPLTLKGPASYTWNIKPGVQSFDIVPGKYKYSYKACGGTTKTGTFQAKKDNEKLVLAVCKGEKAGGGMVNVTIQNKTGGTITLNLTGPASYTFSLKPGKSSISVIAGKYAYTGWGCGGASHSGTRKLRNGFVWTWFCL